MTVVPGDFFKRLLMAGSHVGMVGITLKSSERFSLFRNENVIVLTLSAYPTKSVVFRFSFYPSIF